MISKSFTLLLLIPVLYFTTEFLPKDLAKNDLSQRESLSDFKMADGEINSAIAAIDTSWETIIACPPDRTVQCESDVLAQPPVVVSSCDLGYNTTSSPPILISGAKNCPGAIYEITYTITDSCGSTDQCTQRFTIDNPGPVLACPSDRIVKCESDIAPQSPAVITYCGVGYTSISSAPILISVKRIVQTLFMKSPIP